MNRVHSIVARSCVALSFAVLGWQTAQAAGEVSAADRAFVEKVSQGGMYEVQLGKLAEEKGMRQDIKDQANTESHDHQLVGAKLKSIAADAGIPLPDTLNADFQARLDRIGKLSGPDFDAQYLKDMDAIHKADGAAFAQEAKAGSYPALKAFAAETHRIVERHLGELDAKTH